MRNMLVLGRQDTQLGMIIFQPLFISMVYNKFPTSIMNKIIGCEGTADVHFENVLDKITKWRKSAQKVLLAKEADDSHDDQGGGGRGRGDRERDRDREGQGSQGFRGKGSYLTRRRKGRLLMSLSQTLSPTNHQFVMSSAEFVKLLKSMETPKTYMTIISPTSPQGVQGLSL